MVAHDAKELMRSLLPFGVDVTGLAMDTAVAAYLLDPSSDHYRLGDLASRFLGVEVDDGSGAKGQGTFLLEAPADPDVAADPDGDRRGGRVAVRRPSDPAAIDAARLASVVARLRVPLLEALEAEGELGLYHDIERPLVRVLARMEVAGIPVDRAVLRRSPPSWPTSAGPSRPPSTTWPASRSRSTRCPSCAPCSTTGSD